MVNKLTRKALAEDVKREVLMELSRNHQHNQMPFSDRALVEAIKNEVLADIGNVPSHQDRTMIESIKREVIAQMDSERGNQGETHEYEHEHEHEQGQGRGQMSERHHYGSADPALVQAVKDSVMAEMRTTHYR
ncbi:MAG TPA: hypothetical protein VFD15_00890 [Clostridia bacterium]|nr:hypothetical protein [Clostridia bacterium]